jgi:hypothetical protein
MSRILRFGFVGSDSESETGIIQQSSSCTNISLTESRRTFLDKDGVLPADTRVGHDDINASVRGPIYGLFEHSCLIIPICNVTMGRPDLPIGAQCIG